MTNQDIIQKYKENNNSDHYEEWIMFLERMLMDREITENQFEELMNLSPQYF
jgi:hypothetical protein